MDNNGKVKTERFVVSSGKLRRYIADRLAGHRQVANNPHLSGQCRQASVMAAIIYENMDNFVQENEYVETAERQ